MRCWFIGPLLLLCGCLTPTNRDPVLSDLALKDWMDLKQIFQVSGGKYPTVLWNVAGKGSSFNNGLVLISLEVKNNPVVLRAHIRHEMFHALTLLQDGKATFLNGKKISDYVPGWTALKRKRRR